MRNDYYLMNLVPKGGHQNLWESRTLLRKDTQFSGRIAHRWVCWPNI
jgi:hypothetical protein